jgi:hypothetical protein
MELLLVMLVLAAGVLLLLSTLVLLAFLGVLVAILAGAGLLVAFIARVLRPRSETWELSTKN